MVSREQLIERIMLYAEQYGDFSEGIAAVKAGIIDINCRDDIGYSLLLFAVSHNNYEMAAWLLENGADVNAQQWRGLSVLMFAKTGALVRLLAQYGANPLLLSEYGKTAFDYMLMNRDYEAIDAYLECFPLPPVNKCVERIFVEECDLKRWALLLYGYHATEEQLAELERARQVYMEKKVFNKLCREVEKREKVG